MRLQNIFLKYNFFTFNKFILIQDIQKILFLCFLFPSLRAFGSCKVLQTFFFFKSQAAEKLVENDGKLRMKSFPAMKFCAIINFAD